MRTNDSHFASSLKSGNGQNFQFVRLQGMQKVFPLFTTKLEKSDFSGCISGYEQNIDR